MKYTALQLCGKLFVLVAGGKSVDEIAAWARTEEGEALFDSSDVICDFLSELSDADEPETTIKITTIIKKCLDILIQQLSVEDAKCKELFSNTMLTPRNINYLSLRLCGELFLLIDKGASKEKIAKWAYTQYKNTANEGCGINFVSF